MTVLRKTTVLTCRISLAERMGDGDALWGPMSRFAHGGARVSDVHWAGGTFRAVHAFAHVYIWRDSHGIIARRESIAAAAM